MNFSVKSYLRGYEVIMENGAVVNGGLVNRLGLAPEETLLLIDRKVYELYPGIEIAEALKGRIITVDATEEEKSIDGVKRLYSEFLDKGITRKHKVVVVGGGIVQDLAGFTCHTFMRGIDWIFCPTTLLAQADSCIGSKTSINFENKKNILGSFYPPASIIIDTEFLNTLSPDAVISGIGEIIKVQFMDTGEATIQLGRDIQKLLDRDPEYLDAYIRRSLEIKRRFIEKDEFDRDERLVMNYGHCFGHAMEAASGFDIPHGIGVIYGLEYSNTLSLNRGLLTEAQYRTMHGVIESALKGFSTEWMNPQRILDFLKHDKKRTGPLLTMILSEGIGRQKKFSDISEEEFIKTCDDFKLAMEGYFC